jgi:hypothetical protein
MPANDVARIFITTVSAVCAALWGYAIPFYLSESWWWRLAALPAGALCGFLVWQRYSTRSVVDPFAEVDVSTPQRVAVTVGAALIGVCGGLFIPFVLTRSFPKWTIAAPLGTLLAILLGLIAWHNPGLFFKNRRF